MPPDLSNLYSLPSLHEAVEYLQALYGQHPWSVGGAYCVALALVSALSLPASAVLLLAGGATFGVLGGSLLGNLASTIGAVITMLAARRLLRERLQAWVQGRWPQHLATFHDAVERDGARTLLSLRLLPVIPYPVANVLSGLSDLPTRTFAWTSFVGMLPGTVVYAYAGAQLGRVDSLGDLLDPALLGGLILLAALPWLPRVVALQRAGR